LDGGVIKIDELQAALATVVGDNGISADPFDTAPYCVDWRGLRPGKTPFVIRPASTEQLAHVMRLLSDVGMPVVPQGGNTSMVAGATPDESGTQAVISLSRMNKVRSIDPVDMTMAVEAGVVLKAVQEAAAERGCMFPLSLASEGSATIGGVLATNAGGNTTIRYGNARDLVLGLEVVLRDGRVWNGMRCLRKDNTGYALRHLFVGSEGTLGLITAATLRLWPKIKDELVIFCSVANENSALSLFRKIQDRDIGLRAFEYMSGAGVELVVRHIDGARLPLARPAQHYVLIDLASSRASAGLRDLTEVVLAEAIESGDVIDAVIAESIAQKAAMWRIREEHSESQRKAGASIKNDISVPVSSVPTFLREVPVVCRQIIPKIRPVPFGHMGDGNIHMNFLQPEDMEAAEFLSRSGEISKAVNEVVRSLGGSMSAEHGIGSLKVDILAQWHEGIELELMRGIKDALDPAGMLNPGKIFSVR